MARRAPARSRNRYRWMSSRFNEVKKDSATLLSQHTSGPPNGLDHSMVGDRLGIVSREVLATEPGLLWVEYDASAAAFAPIEGAGGLGDGDVPVQIS